MLLVLQYRGQLLKVLTLHKDLFMSHQSGEELPESKYETSAHVSLIIGFP